MIKDFITLPVNSFLNQLLGSNSYLGIALAAILLGIYLKTYGDQNWFITVLLGFLAYGGLRYFGFG